MKTNFDSREALIAYLKAQFPDAAARDDHVPGTRGGRQAALKLLAEIQPVKYRKTRSYIDGAVTHLSPYVRHGVIIPAEIRNAILADYDQNAAGKLVNELGWHDYYQRAYRRVGEGVFWSIEPFKTGFEDADYDPELPDDIRRGETGLPCIDAFAHQLHQTGYLHNHARMWLAAYVVHWRRIHWQAGAAWFLEHLLDGDPASNHLSWQWVASTFSHKPYYFNRENLERFTRGRYCSSCPLYGQCDFEGSYETLQDALFRPVEPIESPDNPAWANPNAAPEPPALPQAWPEAERVLVWIHGDRLSPVQPAFEKYPDAPAVFVWDDDLLDQWGITLKRLVFMTECLAEMPVEIDRGDVAARLAAAAEAHGRDIIVTAPSPSPRFETITTALSQNGIRIVVMPEEPLVPDAAYDLRRFSRYWRKAQKRAFDYP